MARKTITAANSVYILTVDILYPQGVQLQGYTADAAFATEAVEPTENMVGVDGIMSSGFVPYLTPQTISLNPDSDSSVIFENWLAYMKAQREVVYADAVISLPSIQRKYAMTKGALSQIVAIPGTQRVLQGREFRITWGSVDPAPF